MTVSTIDPEAIARKMFRYDHVHIPVASPAELNESHWRQFQELGFIAVANVFTPGEITSYLQALTDLIAIGDPKIISFEKSVKDGLSLSPQQREAAVRKCMDFIGNDARLKAMSEHPVFLGIVEKLVGTKVRVSQEMALLKPPRIGREKPWHQDMAYFWLSPPEMVIGTWTALDPATAENGCMHLIPGSHRAGPQPHYNNRNDCHLADEDVKVEQDVIVPLEPGGVLFFSGLLHHATPPNLSESRRRAIQLHYASLNCKTIGAEEHAKMYHDSAGYTACTEHFSGIPNRHITGKPKEI